jgi:hypothetical protein
MEQSPAVLDGSCGCRTLLSVCASSGNSSPNKTHYATQVLHSLTLRDTVRTLLGVEADAGKPLSQIPTPNGVAPLKRRGSSTGVCLNGFFVFYAHQSDSIR